MNIELFGCAGGMAEGFRRAGIRFDLTIDREPDAVASYEANLGHRPVQMANTRHLPSTLDAPALTVAASRPGNGGATLQTLHDVPQSARHCRLDAPALTALGGGGARGSQLVDMPERTPDPNRPPVQLDGWGRTMTTSGGGQQYIIEWPWDRPSTTVCSGPVLAPPDRNGRRGEHQRSHHNAIILSERAAAILQGFPDGWTFSGKSKRARWSQLGQAMPPPLAEAVARSVRAQMASSICAVSELHDCDDPDCQRCHHVMALG